jgi:hypothetical protein
MLRIERVFGWKVRWGRLVAVVAGVLAMFGGVLGVPAASAASCSYPAQVLNLTNWKITLPVAKPDDPNSPLEVKQPALRTYARSPYFVAASNCGSVSFRAPVNGVTTPNSSYPRSELREMTNNGRDNANWSSTLGTHRITITEAFTHLPNVKPHLVGLQIHDANDDISAFRLEGSNLYITDGDNTHYKLVTDRYVLGSRFEARFEVSAGQVRAYYNGTLQATLLKVFTGGYFKAGAYPQANCNNSSPCSSDNYGSVTIDKLSVTHQTTLGQLTAPIAGVM